MLTAGIADQEQVDAASPRDLPGHPSEPARWRAVRAYMLLALLVSIPCFWQRSIQGDDLSSHLYNASLVNKVSAGQLPGLYVAPQFTNVLFDHLLSFLLKTSGVYLAEHIA